MSAPVGLQVGRVTTTPTSGVDIETVRVKVRVGGGERGAVFAWVAPVAVRSDTGEQRLRRRGPAALLRAVPRLWPHKEEGKMESDEVMGTVKAVTGGDAVAAALRGAAQADAAVTSTTVGDRTVFTLTDTMFSGGFGGGGGGEGAQAGMGGGGGGFSRSRPVAIVVAGPDGVEVQPVIDRTAIALAGIGAAVGVLKMLRGRRRRR